MCYFLYGSVNTDVDMSGFDKISDENFKFLIADKCDFFNSIKSSDYNFRLTNQYCDCKTYIGTRKIKSVEVDSLCGVLSSLSKIRNIKYAYLLKRWSDNFVNTENAVTEHISNLDLNSFVANIKENQLYKIELYRKYF